MGAAAVGVAQEEDREGGIDQQDIFHRVVLFLAALTPVCSGASWGRTYGDKHLKNAIETQRVAAYAVFISRQQINQARNGESPDPNEVLALLPDATTVDRATEQAIAYIPQAVREISPLINRRIGMLDTVKPPWYLGGPTLPFVGKSVLSTISDPGRPKVLDDYERRKQNDPTTPYPTAPFLRWDF